MFECDNNIEIQGRGKAAAAPFRGGGKAAAARLTLSIDEGWSVQHVNSGKYVLK